MRGNDVLIAALILSLAALAVFGFVAEIARAVAWIRWGFG